MLGLGKDRFFFSAREAASGSPHREKVSDARCLCSLLRVTQGEVRRCPRSEEAEFLLDLAMWSSGEDGPARTRSPGVFWKEKVNSTASLWDLTGVPGLVYGLGLP